MTLLSPSEECGNLTALPQSRPDMRALDMYALAATAAGVTLLALSLPAEAEIIYTPAHVQILSKHTVPLDLDHDGVKDFRFKNLRSVTSYGYVVAAILSVLPAQTANEVWGHRLSIRPYASALFAGVRVGPKGQFVAGAMRMASELSSGELRNAPVSGYCSGPWANVSHRYLALKFSINGETHFGWARLNVSCPPRLEQITGTLTGYAYETVAGKSVKTGQKHYDAGVASGAASLGRLAQGARGLTAWRRQKMSYVSRIR